MNIKKFEDLNKEGIGIAGGKGANLGELTQAGFPVPPGFVITAKIYKRFMNETGIFNNIMNMLNGLNVNDYKEFEKIATEIKKIIIDTDIPERRLGGSRGAYRRR